MSLPTDLHGRFQNAVLDLADVSNEPVEPELETHAEGCADCRAFRASLEKVDFGLSRSPALAPPDELVQQTLERIAEIGTEPEPPAAELSLSRVLTTLLAELAAGLWALTRLVATPFGFSKGRRWGWALVPVAGAVAMLGTTAQYVGSTEDMIDPAAAPPSTDTSIIEDRFAALIFSDEDSEVAEEEGEYGDDDIPAEDVPSEVELRAALTDERAAPEQNGRAYGWYQPEAINGLDGEQANAEVALAAPARPQVRAVIDSSGSFDSPNNDRNSGHGAEDTGIDRGDASRLAVLQPGFHQLRVDRSPEEDGRDLGGRSQRRLLTRDADELTALDNDFEDGLRQTATIRGEDAGDYWSYRASTEGLQFQSADGYWSNTYRPGDPELRLLERRLADNPTARELSQLAQPSEIQLDPPTRGALALGLSADHGEVEGAARVMMAVHLRGVAQRVGRRPTLRTQVVLDLREPLDADAQVRVRALLTALRGTRDGADRIGILTAGPNGGELIAPGRLRFGELAVALRTAFGPGSGTSVTLTDAVEDAVESLAAVDDAGSPLGTAVVLLITPGLSDEDARAIEQVAHLGTLAGVTTTTIGLSDRAVLAPLERVALAGQGRRFILESPAAADAVIRREVSAASRVIARAVRLRIRLAEGVSLVDILDSNPLNEAASQRVRNAERAIDRDLAQRLGILSDRGDDEDGIQIVVPAFYSGDSHTVLLDLVVNGPGPVADVSVRFKDLVRVSNGSLSERLVLGRGDGAPGPRERSVVRAHLAQTIATGLRAAATEVARGAPDAARGRLAQLRAQIESAQRAMPALVNDTGLARDLALLARYDAALGAQQDGLVDSFNSAANRRLNGAALSLE